MAALTPTADEVASGAVNHALRFILPNDQMKAEAYVHPATHAGGPESTEADAPPYGVRFRLKPDFDESGYTEPQKVILEALKKHGMLLSDGGDIALTFADDRTAPPNGRTWGSTRRRSAASASTNSRSSNSAPKSNSPTSAREIPEAQHYSSGWPMCLPSSAREWMPSLR